MRTMTSGEVGKAIGLAAATVQKYARDGRIPCETTPGGHRRYDLAEVRAALSGPSSTLRSQPLASDGGLGAGAPITYSRAAAAERDTRAIVALPAQQDGAGGRTALQDLFEHARRVLVTTGR